MIMTTMKSSLRRLLLACAAGACLAGSAPAQSPQATLRTFAEWASPNEACVDWEAGGSQRIVAHKDGNTDVDVLEFITIRGNYNDSDAVVRDNAGKEILNLESTVWLRLPVIHVTSSGVEEVRFIYWLLEDVDADGDIDPPRSGMTAATGPDGEVTPFVTIRVTQAPSSDIDNPNKWYLDPIGGTKLCIAHGLFDK